MNIIRRLFVKLGAIEIRELPHDACDESECTLEHYAVIVRGERVGQLSHRASDDTWGAFDFAPGVTYTWVFNTRDEALDYVLDGNAAHQALGMS